MHKSIRQLCFNLYLSQSVSLSNAVMPKIHFQSSSQLLKYTFDKMTEMSPLSPLIELSYCVQTYCILKSLCYAFMSFVMHPFPGRKNKPYFFHALCALMCSSLRTTRFAKIQLFHTNAFVLNLLLFSQLRCILSLIYLDK